MVVKGQEGKGVQAGKHLFHSCPGPAGPPGARKNRLLWNVWNCWFKKGPIRLAGNPVRSTCDLHQFTASPGPAGFDLEQFAVFS